VTWCAEEDLVQDELKVYIQPRATTRLRAANRPWVHPVQAHDARRITALRGVGGGGGRRQRQANEVFARKEEQKEMG